MTEGTSTAAARILVVEDEQTIAGSVTDRLRAEGFEVDLAYDGPAAVARPATRARPRGLDMMLPGFDGLEVCRRMQAERPVPVLMLTARGDETDLLVGLGVGADDYLTKPFSMRELAARVHALLRRVERADRGGRGRRPIGSVTSRSTAPSAGSGAGRGGAPDAHRVRPALHLAAEPARRAQPRRLLPEIWGWADASARAPSTATSRPCAASSAPTSSVRCTASAMRSNRRREHRRPLDPVRSIKLKLGLLGVAGGRGLLSPGSPSAGRVDPRPAPRRGPGPDPGAGARHDQAAAGYDRGGPGYGPRRLLQRVRATSRDEVGELARAFNLMAADLAAADRHRRELIANVSHELRTPAPAQHGLLENTVDGVARPDRRRCGPRWPRPSGWAGSLPSFSTCPGSTRGRTAPSRGSRWNRSFDGGDRRGAGCVQPARVHARMEPAGRDRAGDRERLSKSCSTCSTTRPVTHPPAVR